MWKTTSLNVALPSVFTQPSTNPGQFLVRKYSRIADLSSQLAMPGFLAHIKFQTPTIESLNISQEITRIYSTEDYVPIYLDNVSNKRCYLQKDNLLYPTPSDLVVLVETIEDIDLDLELTLSNIKQLRDVSSFLSASALYLTNDQFIRQEVNQTFLTGYNFRETDELAVKYTARIANNTSIGLNSITYTVYPMLTLPKIDEDSYEEVKYMDSYFTKAMRFEDIEIALERGKGLLLDGLSEVYLIGN